jgi:hypothetical protein
MKYISIILLYFSFMAIATSSLYAQTRSQAHPISVNSPSKSIHKVQPKGNNQLDKSATRGKSAYPDKKKSSVKPTVTHNQAVSNTDMINVNGLKRAKTDRSVRPIYSGPTEAGNKATLNTQNRKVKMESSMQNFSSDGSKAISQAPKFANPTITDNPKK